MQLKAQTATFNCIKTELQTTQGHGESNCSAYKPDATLNAKILVVQGGRVYLRASLTMDSIFSKSSEGKIEISFW